MSEAAVKAIIETRVDAGVVSSAERDVAFANMAKYPVQSYHTAALKAICNSYLKDRRSCRGCEENH